MLPVFTGERISDDDEIAIKPRNVNKIYFIFISNFCKLHARDARGPLLPHASPSAMLSLPPDHVNVRLHAPHDRRRLAQKEHVDLKELLTRSG